MNAIKIYLTEQRFNYTDNYMINKNKSNYTEKEMDLALKLIDSMTSKFNPSEYKDEYQDKIKDAIEQKVAGKEIKQTKNA